MPLSRTFDSANMALDPRYETKPPVEDSKHAAVDFATGEEHDIQEGGQRALKRDLKNRHMQMIAIGTRSQVNRLTEADKRNQVVRLELVSSLAQVVRLAQVVLDLWFVQEKPCWCSLMTDRSRSSAS